MADIELIIRISEEDFEIMKHNIAVNNPLCPLSQEEMVSKVANGTPLPKKHGDLIDRSKLLVELECGIRAGNYEEGYEKYPHINDMDDCFDTVKYADTIIESNY